jgi:hypothetical protein
MAANAGLWNVLSRSSSFIFWNPALKDEEACSGEGGGELRCQRKDATPVALSFCCHS